MAGWTLSSAARNRLAALRGNDSLADAAVALRLARRLPTYLRRPIGPTRCRAQVRTRLDQRADNFRTLLHEAIYQQPTSPYLRLLRDAGCQAGDLDRLVELEGVEGTLDELCRRGVYLRVDELKGRAEVVRGSTRFRIDPRQLHNPRVQRDLEGASSGSRGARTVVPIDLDAIRAQGIDIAVALAARGGLSWSLAVWGVPGGAAMDQVLSASGCGLRPSRWFSQVAPAAPGLHPRYLWSARWLSLISALAGRPLPLPRFVPLDQPEPILEWLAEELRRGRTPCLRTFASSAVRLCQAAQAAGQSLEGVQFWMGGEPVTAARLAVVRAAGGTPFPIYGMAEAGPLATGCQAPAEPDDLHLFTDRLALVQPGEASTEATLPADGLLITTLLPSARVVLLNVALGDRADLSTRRCGCPLESLGWTTHLQSVRGYQRVTAAGMTFLDADIVRVLDEELPARFGGGPGNYQLLEAEGEAGQARLTLLVDPSIGPLDAAQVREAFLASITTGSGVERVMGLAWRTDGLVRVERGTPRSELSGKIQHLHQVRRPAVAVRERSVVSVAR